MKNFQLAEMEGRLADLIWQHAPLKTRMLIELCQSEFNWKRTTTYTMLKRLCEREIFINHNGCIKVLIKRDDFLARKGEAFLEASFGGSLPRFLTAFTKRRKLSRKEIDAIQQMIDQYKG